MAPDCRGVIADLKTDKTNRNFAELKAILESFGFEMRARQSRGSHRPFSKPGCFIQPSIPEGRGSVLAVYVRKVVQALEECCDAEHGG